MTLRYLSLKFFILSLFLHAIILTTVIFIFPVGEAPFKPRFIFFGSILTQQDMKRISWEKKDLQSEILSEVWMHEGNSFSNNPFFTPFIQKPLPGKEQNVSAQKVLFKSFFSVENQSSQEKQEESSEQNIGIDTGVEGYRPLRFHTR